MKKIKSKISKNIKLLKFYFLYFNKITFKNQEEKSKKEIIIVFDGNFPHGGLVDRLKGILSFYQVAKSIDADFKIYFKNPFDLKEFLVPNAYDWTSTAADLSWNPFSTKILYLMLNFNFNPIEYISKSNKKKFIVFCNIDYSNAIDGTLNMAEQQKNWSNSFRELFKKSTYLDTEYSKLNIQENAVAIHARFTSLFGDFKDSPKDIATPERKKEIKSVLKNEIDKIALENKAKNVYVFSDSIQFLDFIKQETNYVVFEGKPQHIDSDKNSNELDSHIKTFLDFYAISACEKVFLIRTKDMYNSAFSKYAAIVGNKEFKIINK